MTAVSPPCDLEVTSSRALLLQDRGRNCRLPEPAAEIQLEAICVWSGVKVRHYYLQVYDTIMKDNIGVSRDATGDAAMFQALSSRKNVTP